MNRRSLMTVAAIGAVLIAGGYALARQGLQTCGWLDRLAGLSACEGSQSFAGVLPGRLNAVLPYGDQGQYLMASDLLTADGWRTGLILFDPISGQEAGRYQVPMRYGDFQLFTTPGESQILLVCGVTVPRCADGGVPAVSVSPGALQEFRDFPLADPYISGWPGTPFPDEETYGTRARFVAGGARILSDRRNEGLRLFDPDGTLVADLTEQRFPVQHISLSPDGMRIASWDRRGAPGGGDRVRLWDAMEGRLLAEIEGASGWHLRGQPFWSTDGKMLFAPRFSGGTMTLERFGVP